MNACPRPKAIYLYLEGELGPYEAAKLEEHLECCAACREALEERRLLHEAFTSLPPFEVPEGFARSVMDSLPAPETAKAGWLAPLLAAAAALTVGLAGFHIFTGQSVFGMLVAVNRFLGEVVALFTPLAVKTLKIGSVLAKVAGNLAGLGFSGLSALTRILGPEGIALAAGLSMLFALLAFFGARRFLRQGVGS
ncbi:MAG TPA: zf-HC2 domain-containing protein [Candidatus Aminicenantes bacterium]|nr:zf-HC2 domain-containing protein [Candidatus Aminicenantes bacterium]HDT13461.1 zf-HC2 domain-containing protein [Candidatus Aminicenantes bacterium]